MTDFSIYHERTKRAGQYDEGRSRGEVSIQHDQRTYYYHIPVAVRPCARKFKAWAKEVFLGLREHEPVITGSWPEYWVD